MFTESWVAVAQLLAVILRSAPPSPSDMSVFGKRSPLRSDDSPDLTVTDVGTNAKRALQAAGLCTWLISFRP